MRNAVNSARRNARLKRHLIHEQTNVVCQKQAGNGLVNLNTLFAADLLSQWLLNDKKAGSG
ncbi:MULTISPECIES: hypothetical protein [Erwinia]|uniref:hypothetical protein n=1 Tax=Erwinia TaxID=551 RepID=UPI000AC158DE|nr:MULTISPECIES: hypothetical protein [Erwinia]